ncbi:MAG: class I SAM-dependent methyltransferase [Chloroflexi bacterium]|nr:class I SAM-dependent methyltransferase [Chloroflexota bacterium]
MPAFDHFAAIAPLYARVAYSKTNVMSEIAKLPVKGSLLDVGGGTGRVSSAIRDLVDEAVIADVSFGMLKQSPQTHLRPVCGGSESLPFADNSFERVIMVDALHHVIDHAESAREMFRVLKPGGLLVIEEPDIRTFGVKLIALAEKLLLMRSHFLTPDEVMKLFAGSEKKVRAEDGTAWVVVGK